MTTHLTARCRGSYGIDAPVLLGVPITLILAGVTQAVAARSGWPLIGVALVLISVGVGAHASLRGKRLVWDELLASLRGDERVLDLGCGRGAVLVTAARHLRTGRAAGVDIWRRSDQSGNRPEATLRNAFLEGVGDRVEVRTADMTALPFPDASFDVVVSMSAVHNVGAARVDRAIDEAVRVLRPGGRLLIADLRYTGRYRRRLIERGMADVRRRNLGWRLWWSGPWLPTRLVSARKPLP
jgi:cyclopropane fatty-acyl-phospholipid synthase-like methyltransferase